MFTEIVIESIYIALQAALGISIGLDICFVGYMLIVWFLDEKQFRLPSLGEWKSFCYTTLIVCVATFIFGFLFNLDILNEARQDEQLSTMCTPAILGDTHIINGIEITIGTAYRLDSRVVKYGRVNYEYAETAIFVNSTPVVEFQGYRIVDNNRQKEYLCSEKVIEEIY